MSNASQSNRTQSGFTLIELMVVVAIVALIAAIAYPSYRRSVIKSDRSDAKVALQKAAQAFERCYAESHSYKASPHAKRPGTCPEFPRRSQNEYYNITLPKVTTTTYTIKAEPVAGGPQQDDAGCTSFTLKSNGAQSATGNNSDHCW
jgi:type IV pilus assembly protein PilE